MGALSSQQSLGSELMHSSSSKDRSKPSVILPMLCHQVHCDSISVSSSDIQVKSEMQPPWTDPSRLILDASIEKGKSLVGVRPMQYGLEAGNHHRRQCGPGWHWHSGQLEGSWPINTVNAVQRVQGKKVIAHFSTVKDARRPGWTVLHDLVGIVVCSWIAVWLGRLQAIVRT